MSKQIDRKMSIGKCKTIPKVSVCVITYNQEKYIRRCLQSIVDQETDFSFEVIIGDDCSNDKTELIINEFLCEYSDAFRVIRQPHNTGGTKNLYDVYEAAQGHYIAHVDGDDAMLPGKLQAQVDFFEGNPQCSIVAHDARVIDSNNNVIRDSWATEPLKKFYLVEELVEAGTFFTHSSKMFRTAAIVSHFRDRPTVDLYFHIEHALSGVIGYIDQVLCEYRMVSGLSAVGGSFKFHVLVAHMEAYQFAREQGVSRQLVDAAERNFRYVQGMMALRAGRYDLFKFLFSKRPEGGKSFSRHSIFSAFARWPKAVHKLVRFLDKVRSLKC